MVSNNRNRGNAGDRGAEVRDEANRHGDHSGDGVPRELSAGTINNRDDASGESSASGGAGQDLDQASAGRDQSAQAGSNGPSTGPSSVWDHIGETLPLHDSWGLPGDPARSEYPTVWALLCDRKFPSGKSREGAVIRIFATTTGIEAILTDLSLGHKLSVRVEHIGDVLRGLETLLAGPKTPWIPLAYGEAAIERRTAEKEAMKKLGSTGRPGRR